MSLSATILITTKNRKSDLAAAISSALSQPCVIEVFVFDDGSTDGTSAMVKAEFPTVKLSRSEASLGIVSARNLAIGLASGDVVITIDDDCMFGNSETVRATLDDFCSPEVGAVAIPHINVNSSGGIHSQAPDRTRRYAISQFTGGACAIKKDIFVKLGGYDSNIWRQGEESDYCTRLLAAGYITLCGSAGPILHYESPKRDNAAIHYHAARSGILYAWSNVPLWALPFHLSANIVQTLLGAYSNATLLATIRGILSGLASVLRLQTRRAPIPTWSYRLFRRLRKRGPLPFDEVVKLVKVSSLNNA